MIVHHDVVQRTAAWQQLRAGKLTASRAHDILTRGRGRGCLRADPTPLEDHDESITRWA